MNEVKHKRSFFAFILISLTVVSGCWDKREMNELAFVSAFAVDLNEEGKYVGTFQIINPGNVAGGLQGGGGQNASITVYSAAGDNLLETEGHVSMKVSRDLYYAHTNLIIISEKVASEKGITELFDLFERAREFRTTTNVVLTRNSSAEEMLSVLTEKDKIPAEQIVNNLKGAEESQGEYQKITIDNVINSLITSGNEPLISAFSIKGEPKKGTKMENIQASQPEVRMEPNGLGVFKNGKLIDWLEGETARGTLWATDKVQATSLNITWKNKKDAIAYQVVRQKTKIAAQLKKDRPKISISVRAEGRIAEVSVSSDLTNPHTLAAIEKEVAKEIKEEIEKAIYHAQINKSDTFGFGDAIHRSHPDKWKKIKSEWNNEYFPSSDIEVKVEAFIRRTGLRTNSYLSDLEQ